MIRLGCLSLSYRDAFDAGRVNLDRFIELASEMRLDAIDIHSNAFPATDAPTLRRIRRNCHERGLDLSYIGISNNFGKSGDALRQDVALVKKWVDVASEMGIPLVRVFAAWNPPGEPESAVWDRMLAAMGEVAAYGELRDVVIGVQNHNHGCVTRTGDDVLRILRSVESPYLGHILDTGQYVGSPGASGSSADEPATDQAYESIATTASRALHVRAKFYRVSSGEERWLDYPRILDILASEGFNGTMSVVYEGWSVEPSDTAVPKATAYLRRLLREKNL